MQNLKMIVGDVEEIDEAAENPALRAQRLLGQAREAADRQVLLLEQALAAVHNYAADVADGGEIYPVGVRDLAQKLADDSAWCAHTISSIMAGSGARRSRVELELVEHIEPEHEIEYID